jgi:penicillin-binding protein 1B
MPQPKVVLSDRARRIINWSALSVAVIIIAAAISLVVASWRLSKRVDAQLSAGPFAGSFNYYAAPETISIGDQTSQADVTALLRQNGFREATSSQPRTWHVTPAGLVVCTNTGAQAVIHFKADVIDAISGSAGEKQLQLQPALITNISGSGRQERIIVHFSDLPPVLVNAVVSAEDKRFFEHAGLDPLRVARAAFVDIRDRRKEQGASTITMQLARNLYLDPQKRWTRKLSEVLITLHLERALSKEQIFAYYANQVYLGRQGPFDINGFGKAAKAYFNKDVSRLSLPEAATLAGMIQRPSYFDPYRYPERVMDRRNLVLELMKRDKHITQPQYEAACAAPLGLHRAQLQDGSTQYFLDLAADRVHKDLGDYAGHVSANVYTTLDPRLQAAAEQAVEDGMKLVDKRIHARHESGPMPQVALIALDPHTGAIKALIGGRSYAQSQLNRVQALRPPGSVFKPFVYAAALDSAVEGGPTLFYPASVVDDEPTTFTFAKNQTWAPGNFKQEYDGQVTFRQALMKSLNVATVKVAQEVGFRRVIAMARRAGITSDLAPTPAVAIGSYGVMPMEIARAYTVFGNDGTRVEPRFLDSINEQDGTEIYHTISDTAPALDPRVNFLMVSMMEDVINHGTAVGVRARGFRLPAAGKTGTSHDGWFAGFTSQLLCVVWVGFDDYRDLDLEGAHSALPIWTEFMQQAARYGDYRNAQPFKAPDGVVQATIDPTTGQLATTYCPLQVTDYFVDGSQPAEACTTHTGTNLQVASDGVAADGSGTQGSADRAADPASAETMSIPVKTTGEGTRKVIVPAQNTASDSADTVQP